MRIPRHSFGVLGMALLLAGCAIGLFSAPAERHMGDVSRIFYVHVPSAQVCLLIYTFAFAFAVLSLWTSGAKWDARTTAALEVGVVLNIVLLPTGMLFARPTWGVWWDWDVRLTTSLVALLLFGGVLALRSFTENQERRATFTAVATILAWVDVPLIYFGVKWWRSLHQVQSSPSTVDSAMVLPYRLNAFGLLFLAIWLISLRSEIERDRLTEEAVPEPEPLSPVAA